MRCKYDGSGVWEGRCTGTKELDLCPGHGKCSHYTPEYKDKLSALEYMEKQLQKHRLNYEREKARGVPEQMIQNILAKIGYYADAVQALGGKP